MIVDSYQVDALIQSNGGQFSVANLPGGAQLSPLPGACYGMTVLGWAQEGLAGVLSGILI